MAAAKDLMQLDLYNLLGIHPDAKEKEIKKAYRKKALSCHPDKNKDNPNAVELFHQLSKALEILTDSAARAAYDRVLKARKAAEIRNKALDSRRKKFKDDLDAREKYSQDQSFDVEANFKNEIDRLRKEGSKQLEEEQEYLRMQLKKINEQAEVQSSEKILPSLSVKWERGKKYTNEELHNIFSKYGQISCIIILNSEKGKALVEFMNSSSAESAFQQEMQFKLKWLQGRPTAKTTGFSFSAPTKETTITNRDYESLTLMKMRQSQERKRLIEQMQKEEGTNVE